jgi:tetratricopeptide (TPR) repeat protein
MSRRTALHIGLLIAVVLSACVGQRATPTPTLSVQAAEAANWAAKGDALLAVSDFDGAEAAYRQAIDVDPSYAPAYSHLSYALLFRPGKQKAAVEEARQATELAPDSGEAWAYLGRAYDWKGAFDDALVAAEKGAELDPRSANAHSFLGEVYADLRTYDKAVKAAERAVKLDPDNAEAHRNLGYIYQTLNRRDEALEAYQTAYDLEPDFVHRLTSLAAYYLYTADDEGTAVEWLDRAKALAPDDYLTLLFLSRVESRHGNTEAAVGYCQRILEVAPDAPEGHNCLGDVYLDAGDYQKAEAERQAAIEADPDLDHSYIGLGYVYYVADDCERAVAQFKKAVDIHPRNGGNHSALGLAYSCAGQTESAEEAYEEAVALEPHSGDHHVRLGRLYLETDRAGDAEREFNKAIDLDPEEDQYYIWLARAYLAQDEFDEAIAQYERAAEIDPDNATHALAIGYAYLGQKRDAETAEAYFQKALDLYAEQGATAIEIAQANYAMALTHLNRESCREAMPYLEGAIQLDASLADAANYLILCMQAVGLEEVDLPAGLTQSGQIGRAAALALVVDSLEELDIQAEADFQSDGDGKTFLVVLYGVKEGLSLPQFLRQRGLVVYASSVALPQIVPAVDGLAVVATDDEGNAVSLLNIDREDARLWTMGLLTNLGYVAKWREAQP